MLDSLKKYIIKIKNKACPDPSSPIETLVYYTLQLSFFLRISLYEQVTDPWGLKRRKDYQSLYKYQNSGKGRPCFVLANGPSVNQLDPIKIAAYCSKYHADVFCVNYFPNSEFAKKSGISYWVLSDPNSFDLTREENKEAFRNAQNIVKKGIFIAHSKTTLNLGINLPLIPFNDKATSHIFSHSIHPAYPRSYLSMTAYKALALAVFGGYSPIYIFGFDNTYIRQLNCDEKNRIYRMNEHFDKTVYAKTDTKRQYLNFHYRTVADELIAYSRLFSDLKKFKNFPIVNIDINSLTDAFPKQNIIDVFL